MKKRNLTILVAALLTICILFSSCATATLRSTGGDATRTPITTELPAPPSTEPTTDEQLDYNDSGRPKDEDALPEVPFSELTYARPDAVALCAGFKGLQEITEGGASLDELVESSRAVCMEYAMFNTMSSYAYIRYSIDLNDTYYEDENNWCDQQSPVIEQAKERCFTAMANSPLREELEEAYYGEDFFDFYDEFQIYNNDRVVELMQQDSELQSKYMALQSDQTISWNGEEVLFDELLDDPELDYYSMLDAYRVYYETYGPTTAEYYREMIKLRREIATELGYDTYADFAYAYSYQRDYTPEQAAQYTAEIADKLTPYFYSAVSQSYSEPMDTDTTMSMLRQVADTFGGEFSAAYDYMTDYALFDISSSSSKMPGSFMTYLPSYEMPYLYVSPTGDIADLMTAAHEFGHFVDGYVNCNGTISIDCAEIFSQGLEFLTLNRAELSENTRAALTTSKLADSLMVFLGQGCYAEFERRAYELSDEELTYENLNALFNECNEEFGMGMTGLEDIIGPGWISINHFFVAPFYVISYCVSADVALQIFETEQENGNGLAVYRDLMALTSNNTILNLLDEADLPSPFAAGRIDELAWLFDAYLS